MTVLKKHDLVEHGLSLYAGSDVDLTDLEAGASSSLYGHANANRYEIDISQWNALLFAEYADSNCYAVDILGTKYGDEVDGTPLTIHATGQVVFGRPSNYVDPGELDNLFPDDVGLEKDVEATLGLLHSSMLNAFVFKDETTNQCPYVNYFIYRGKIYIGARLGVREGRFSDAIYKLNEDDVFVRLKPIKSN